LHDTQQSLRVNIDRHWPKATLTFQQQPGLDRAFQAWPPFAVTKKREIERHLTLLRSKNLRYARQVTQRNTPPHTAVLIRRFPRINLFR
jgi:hypothetical protein